MGQTTQRWASAGLPHEYSLVTMHIVLEHVSHVCRHEAEAERAEVFQVLDPAVRVRGCKLEQGHVHEEASHHATQYVEHQGVFLRALPRAEARFGGQRPGRGLGKGWGGVATTRAALGESTCTGRPTPEGGGLHPEDNERDASSDGEGNGK
eukprot:scaffold58602_cov62-Phaeocystis_antarctica.AAC.9